MHVRDALFIDGRWRPAAGSDTEDVIEAATEQVLGRVPSAADSDVDAAVDAARRAFPGWAAVPVGDRADLLTALADGVVARQDALAELMSREVGTPLATSHRVQVDLAVAVLRSMAELVVDFPMEERLGSSVVIRVPAGVVGAITPWNFPLYQIAAKVGPALAAGCTAVVKPSSVAPLAAFVLADVAAEVGLPPGVLNVVTGRGTQVGEALVTAPGVDFVSLTGSVRAGARVGELAARDIKRVTLELGGKSAFILGPGADLDAALAAAVRSCFNNNGQTCSATTRLLAPRPLLAEVEDRVAAIVGAMRVGDPLDPTTDVGPVASAGQFQSIQNDLLKGLDEGQLLVGGLGRHDDHESGYFVRPTVVSRLAPQAHLAREEIFGPVMSIVPVDDVEAAVQVANDSDYGLSGAVWAGDLDTALSIARRLRTGQVSVNGGRMNVQAPFGGFKRSGVGRELGPHGLAEYFELVAMHLPPDAA